MSTEHPITPSGDVIEALRSQAPQCDVDAGVNKVRETQLVIAAYRAGADHELEEILLYPGDEPENDRYFDWVLAANIRAWRRPKPLSLAKQALSLLPESGVSVMKRTYSPGELDVIRAALERLQQLEQESNG